MALSASHDPSADRGSAETRPRVEAKRCGIVRSVVREQRCGLSIPKIMSSSNHISTLYREFADALRDVLAENAVGLASRGRLARTRAAVKKHPDYSEHGYFLAVEMAFKQWEAMQNAGSPQKTSDG